jgi:catechol 2,3-dioxygenase-like lactoylglutathione lyase family enzyme
MVELRLTTVTLGAPDHRALADFYRRLLGWPATGWDGEDDWLPLRDPAGGVGLAFQHEPDQPAAVWPHRPGEPQMMAHLEIRVDDLAAGVAHALACGATLAARQDQDDVRVCVDPAGHPFCLWVG